MNPNEIKEASPLTWGDIKKHVMKTGNYPRFVWYLHEDNIFRLRHYFDSVGIRPIAQPSNLNDMFISDLEFPIGSDAKYGFGDYQEEHTTRQEAEQSAIEKAFDIREAILKGDNQK